ncbi:IclR family transcriptional regulator, partial [Amycolatopsis sp. WAC 04169]
MGAPESAQHPLTRGLLAAIVNAGMHQRAQGDTTVALQHRPTAPHHSAQDALRVLETVARHTSGVTDTKIARRSGLDRERLTPLLRMLRR